MSFVLICRVLILVTAQEKFSTFGLASLKLLYNPRLGKVQSGLKVKCKKINK